MKPNSYWMDYDWSTEDMRLGIEQENHPTENERFVLHFNIPPNTRYHDKWMMMADVICSALNQWATEEVAP